MTKLKDATWLPQGGNQGCSKKKHGFQVAKPATAPKMSVEEEAGASGGSKPSKEAFKTWGFLVFSRRFLGVF